MYVVVGASGNTGSVVAHMLLDNGKQVRVLGRTAEHLRQFANRGAEPVVVDLADTSKVAYAFDGAEAVYAMIPPNPSAPDIFEYDERITASLSSALSEARVKHAVCLSSVGADKPSGTGVVIGLHRFERALDRVDGLNTLHLRAGYFMENTLPQAGIIHAMGGAMGPMRADLKLPMIASHDIGVAAARALLQLSFKGHESRELLGQRDISYAEVASIIGKAIGKPDLKYNQAPDDQLRPALAKMGMSPNFVDQLLEMTAALNSGKMKALEPRTPQNTTTTTYETFMAEKFLPTYKGTSKAA
ncbi:MAG TPA: NmrA family NAD(P)-binding protein [Silvibacterium sp.]|nr:NmrA family NAD(P)-binding protein [Silvibacterium sp.]